MRQVVYIMDRMSCRLMKLYAAYTKQELNKQFSNLLLYTSYVTNVYSSAGSE